MRKAHVCGWHLINTIPCDCCGGVARVLVTFHSDEEPWGTEMNLCNHCDKLLREDPETDYSDGVANTFAKVFGSKQK